ncbi:MAG: hypothetical protein HQL19_06645 [Candidatus Omnitrophica bacterium]|nr:hypothetical protein [Candidatus Omnitrophota bacterium]
MMNPGLFRSVFPRVIFLLVIAGSLAVNILRFVNTKEIPYGCHIDEIGIVSSIRCIATEGVDPLLHPPALFINLFFESPRAPTYVYPGILWGKAFGFSCASMRAFSAFLVVFGIAGLFFLARRLWGWQTAGWVVFLASISPWMWALSRIAFESQVAASFFIWGMYFIFRRASRWNAFMAAFMLGCAMYTYLPFRLVVPLVLPLFFWARAERGALNKGWHPVFWPALVLISVPLVQGMLNGELMGRFNELCLVSKNNLGAGGGFFALKNALGMFVHNYGLHFSPHFLFVQGDDNVMFTSHFGGILSWPDMLALLFGGVLFAWSTVHRKARLFCKDRRILVVCVICFLVGFVPSGLTNVQVPNALRSIGAWPFLMLLGGFCIREVQKRVPLAAVLAVLIAGTFACVYLKDYFGPYQARSRGMFDFWSYDMAKNARTNEDWLNFMYFNRHKDFTLQYYLMEFKGDSCSQARQAWVGFNKFLDERGIQ